MDAYLHEKQIRLNCDGGATNVDVDFLVDDVTKHASSLCCRMGGAMDCGVEPSNDTRSVMLKGDFSFMRGVGTYLNFLALGALQHRAPLCTL